MASMTVSLSSDTPRGDTLSVIASVNGLTSRLTRSNIKSTLGSVVIRIADMAAVTGPITFLVTTVILESIQTEYNRIQDTISALVWGQHGWCQTTVFYIFAFALASLALRFRILSGGKRDLKLGIALVALMSLGFIIVAVFPTKAPGALVTLNR